MNINNFCARKETLRNDVVFMFLVRLAQFGQQPASTLPRMANPFTMKCHFIMVATKVVDTISRAVFVLLLSKAHTIFYPFFILPWISRLIMWGDKSPCIIDILYPTQCCCFEPLFWFLIVLLFKQLLICPNFNLLTGNTPAVG